MSHSAMPVAAQTRACLLAEQPDMRFSVGRGLSTTSRVPTPAVNADWAIGRAVSARFPWLTSRGLSVHCQGSEHSSWQTGPDATRLCL